MKFAIKLAAALLLGTSSLQAHAAPPSAEVILERAEEIRQPDTDYRVRVVLEDRTSGSAEANVKEFETLIKGRDKALVNYTKPASDVGKQVLMVDSDMWIFMPKTAKPIRISPKQKVAGNAAYGDIARLNFIGNYSAELVETAKIDGKPAYVLELNAIAGKTVSYAKVDYIVASDSFRPIKAVYRTKSGKALREVYYEDYQQVMGVERPTTFRMVDMVRQGVETRIMFKEAAKADLPALLFKKQNLGRG